jgi:hypothetical protein
MEYSFADLDNASRSTSALIGILMATSRGFGLMMIPNDCFAGGDPTLAGHITQLLERGESHRNENGNFGALRQMRQKF